MTNAVRTTATMRWMAGLAVMLSAVPAAGQWSAVSLHSSSYEQSQITSGSNGVFGGYVTYPPVSTADAVLWDARTLAATILPLPAGAQGAGVLGMSADEQVGQSLGHAMLWRGPSVAPIDLHPSMALVSSAFAVADGVQVGYASIGGEDHAALWAGSAASFVDLTPPGSRRAYANATTGLQHGGWVELGPGPKYTNHAAIWTGSSTSWMDLNPPAGLYSEILAMVPGQQVGMARVLVPQGGGRDHAALWSGTAASWVDLHPEADGASFAYGTNGTAQVGAYATAATGFGHASIWFGSAASMVDLHSFLPPGYQSSVAYGVAEVDGYLIVGGTANRDFSLGRLEAYLWVLAPAPSGSAVLAVGMLLASARRRGERADAFSSGMQPKS